MVTAGKGLTLGSLVCGVLLCFVTFPCGVLGRAWYMIVSIPDVCLLAYFVLLFNIPINTVSVMPGCFLG